MPFPSRPTALVATAALAALSAAPVYAQAASSLGVARYEAARRAIVVPYAGGTPTYTVGTLANPARVYFDFDAAPAFTGTRTGPIAGHPLFTRWATARRGPGSTRLTLTLRRSGEVSVLNDAARRQLVIVPAGQAAPAPAAPVAAPTVPPTPRPAARPTPDPRVRTISQTVGHTDFNYTVGPRPAGAARDRVDVDVRTKGVTDFHVTSEPERDFVSFSISIQGRQPTVRPVPRPSPLPTPSPTPTAIPTFAPLPTPQVDETPPVLVTPTPLPTPADDLPTPTPLPTPGGDLPTPAPSPEPTPEPVPTPEPTPEPTPVPAGEPGNVVSVFGRLPLGINESAQAIGSDFLVEGANQLGAAYEARFGLFDWLVQAQRVGYLVTDQQTNQQTATARSEIEALTAFGLRVTPFGTEEVLGVGYLARYLTNVHQDAQGTPLSPPAAQQTSLLVESPQLLHGPILYGRVDLPVFGPLGLEASGGLAPYLLTALAAPAELNGTLGYWATPGVYLRFGAFQLTGGYYLSSYSATGYDYARSGPQVRIDWRF